MQVFAAEHFIRRVQPWTCAAAPVHDPRTGRVLGAIDITGGDGLAHPHSLGFVQAVARAARQAGRMGQQLSHPLAVALRNTAMRLTPSRAATHMILRHHAWVPPRLS